MLNHTNHRQVLYLNYFLAFQQPDAPQGPTEVAIVAAAGSQCYANNGDSWGIGRSLDEDARTIFHSQTNRNGWAKYYIPPSTVTEVRILNRADCCGKFTEPKLFLLLNFQNVKYSSMLIEKNIDYFTPKII